MKKAFLAAFLLVVIIISFSFAILRIQANGSENNFFNSKYRETFAKNEILRKILGLHFDGDGRSDYLGKKYSKIHIEVDEMAGLSIPTDSLDTLVERMKAATGKDVSYTLDDSAIPYSDYLSEEQISEVVALYRDEKNTSDTASVYLLYMSQEYNLRDRLGLTFQEYGIVLFDLPLVLFSDSSLLNLKINVESTALHEFGHQIGLPHNNERACLMQSTVDSPPGGQDNFETTVTDFCAYEKNLIESIKAKL
jgi:hypothetical protein